MIITASVNGCAPLVYGVLVCRCIRLETYSYIDPNRYLNKGLSSTKQRIREMRSPISGW